MPAQVLSQTERGFHGAVGGEPPEAVIWRGHNLGKLRMARSSLVLRREPRCHEVLKRTGATIGHVDGLVEDAPGYLLQPGRAGLGSWAVCLWPPSRLRGASRITGAEQPREQQAADESQRPGRRERLVSGHRRAASIRFT